jgi:hypothetical protein
MTSRFDHKSEYKKKLQMQPADEIDSSMIKPKSQLLQALVVEKIGV